MSREIVAILYCHKYLISLVRLDRQRKLFMRADVKRREIWEWSDHTLLKDPVIVNSLFLKKPERIEALGLVLLLALLLWRLVERALRVHVETTGKPLPGWDKRETQKPTAFMMMTKFAAVMVIKVGAHRQLAQPLATVQQQYLLALGVPTTHFTVPQSR